MRYISTSQHSKPASLTEAVLHSMANDGGLYMPEVLPTIPQAIFNNLSDMTLPEISYFLSNSFFSGDIPSKQIKKIGDESFNFKMPLVKVEDNIYALELFHGPTFTVKDAGARFLARLMRALHSDISKPLNVLVSTNGNSGAAIANGLHGIDGVNVFAMFPYSSPAERFCQFATLGGNVHALKVHGSIDACRAMINEAMADRELNDEYAFTCANSTNIARLLPNIVVAFYAYAQLKKKSPNAQDVFLSVPTGNGGGLLATLMAKLMGLPVAKLVAACNSNAAFVNYITGAEAHHNTSKRTLAYAMDTFMLSNASRFTHLFRSVFDDFRQDIDTAISDDNMIRSSIKDVYNRTGYVMDPHSAVAYHALKEKLPAGATGLFMATSHPARSAKMVSEIINEKVKLPVEFKRYLSAPSKAVTLAPTYPALRKYIHKILD